MSYWFCDYLIITFTSLSTTGVGYRELDKLQKESVSSWYLSHNQVLNFSFYLYNVQVVLFIPTTEVGQDKLATWFKWRTPYSSVNVG